jgi:AraC family transcriptional regulator
VTFNAGDTLEHQAVCNEGGACRASPGSMAKSRGGRSDVAARWEVVLPRAMLLELIDAANSSLGSDVRAARRHLGDLGALIRGAGTGAPVQSLLIDPTARPCATAPLRGGLAAWQSRRLLDHVAGHLTTPLAVESLAAIVRLSPGHFCRAFKVSFGEPPHGFVVRQRVRRAQFMMLTTNENLSQIAVGCGLTDQAHLTRLFRRFVDDTPHVWRRRWQQHGSDGLLTSI